VENEYKQLLAFRHTTIMYIQDARKVICFSHNYIYCVQSFFSCKSYRGPMLIRQSVDKI